MGLKPVTTYIDYRKYLADYYAFHKRHTRHFSHRWFAEKAGLSSSSYFKRIVDGKRNLTRPMIEKFCAAMKLREREARYFRHLVLFNQAKTAAEKSEHYTTIRTLAGAVHEKVLQADQYDYFKNWYTPVIRELLCMEDFGDDFPRLARMVVPPISAREARDAVRLIKRLGLVKKQPGGGYVQTDKSIAADPRIRSIAARSYTDAMLGHARTALHTMDPAIRNISTMSLGVTREQYAVLAQELEAFKERVKAIVTRDETPEQVYELNFALFPVSRRAGVNRGGHDA